MPIANTNLIPKLRSHINEETEIVSLWGKCPLSELSRQNIVFIANTAPKVITPDDTVYLLIVDHPMLMTLVSCRITNRMNKLFSRSKRRWYLLSYDVKHKRFDEFYLP